MDRISLECTAHLYAASMLARIKTWCSGNVTHLWCQTVWGANIKIQMEIVSSAPQTAMSAVIKGVFHVQAVTISRMESV